MDEIAAIILAAGKGTRMKSARAKMLHEIAGRPMLAFTVEQAVIARARKIVAVVGHQAADVQAALGAALPAADVVFALQREQKGTAHAVLSARDALAGFQGRILLLYGDTPLLTSSTLEALIAAGGKAPLALVATRPPSPHGYGRLVRDAAGDLVEIREERDCTPELAQIAEVNAGQYCVDADLLWKGLAAIQSENAQGEFYLTDLIAQVRRSGRSVATIECPFEEVMGINDRAELARATSLLRERRNDALMKSGVTLLDPATTYIDFDVHLGTDCIIEPGAAIRGKSTLGVGVRVGMGSILSDAQVADGAEVKPYCHIDGAHIGAHAVVGPFARLRPGTELSEDVHIGNFVELKKTRMGRRSKAGHLTYLGDAIVGDNVNVGCGTITCNYDGEKKLTTIIEDGAFIGSDTQLVAPVTVGAGAYVGTGTTVRENVPAGALAVSAGKQRNVDGWVAKRKARQ